MNCQQTALHFKQSIKIIATFIVAVFFFLHSLKQCGMSLRGLYYSTINCWFCACNDQCELFFQIIVSNDLIAVQLLDTCTSEMESHGGHSVGVSHHIATAANSLTSISPAVIPLTFLPWINFWYTTGRSKFGKLNFFKLLFKENIYFSLGYATQ